MQSSAIKDEPKFKEIKKILLDYNKMVMTSNSSTIEACHLRRNVMDSVLKFMRLMMLAPDTQTKKIILNISYNWMTEHLSPGGKKDKEKSR